MFSEIDGVKGESKNKTHAKQIDVLSWSWGMSNNGSADVGGDAGPARSMCRTSGSPSTCLEEVCDPEAALELASTPKGLLSPGSLLAQHYRLLEDLGDSPQGRRFLAEDLQQQRQVSLLALSREFASDGTRLAALKDAVERVRQAPHRRLREVYGLETVQGDSVLVEEHAGCTSLLEVLRSRGALSAPEVVRLVNRLAPLVDHARAHGLEHVELTLLGIHLTDSGSSGSGTQSTLLRQPLTAWPGLELKVNAIDFSLSCVPAGGGAAAATQVGHGTAGDPRGSHVRLLGLLAYEALGGPRARVEATGRYAPVAALGEEGNAVLRRALADECSSGGELARQLAAAAGDAEPVALASRDSATGGSQEVGPQSAPAGPLKKRPFWEERAPRQALALGLVVLVGLGGYAWHRTNRRPQLPSKAAPAPAASAAASPVWDTVLPTFGDDLQPAPSPGKANGVAAEQPASSPVQTDPPTPIGSAAPAASAASATQDLTLPPAAASPSPSPAETRVETTPVQEGGTDATPRPVVLEQDGGAATPDKVPEGGGAQHDEAPAVTPAAPRPKALGRHEHGLRPAARPQPQPTFWQRLFGHKETKKAKPGKPQQ
jgi:serine/threonine protein kinase